MTQIFAKYAVNIVKNEVQMIDGQIKIAPGGWKGITEREVGHTDIVYAIRSGWIKLEDKEPKTAENPPKEKVKVINSDDPAYSGQKEPRVKVSKLGTKQ